MRTQEENTRCVQIANEIYRQIFLSVSKSVFYSWGILAKGCGFYMGMPTFMLQVSGLIHKGWVFVSLDEDLDTYEVRLVDNDRKKVIKTMTDVYAEDLGWIIDANVEKPLEMSDEEYRTKSTQDTLSKGGW